MGLGATAVLGLPFKTRAQSLPKMVVMKDPSCGCCGAWVDHMRSSGFPVEVIETPAINRVKVRLGVPADLASCHTAELDGYARAAFQARAERPGAAAAERAHAGAQRARADEARRRAAASTAR